VPGAGSDKAWPVWERRQSSAAPKRPLNAHAQDFTMPRFPTGAATPRIHRGAFRALAGNRPKARASFAKGRCVRGTASDQATEITQSRWGAARLIGSGNT
jgi:hypothetical protein